MRECSNYVRDALMQAYEKHDLKTITLLINDKDSNVDIDLTIRWAIENEHIEIVRLLLNNRQTCLHDTEQYFSTLVTASRYGHLEVVRLLLTDDRTVIDECRNSAIRKAIRHGHTEIVTELVKWLNT